MSSELDRSRIAVAPPARLSAEDYAVQPPAKGTGRSVRGGTMGSQVDAVVELDAGLTFSAFFLDATTAEIPKHAPKCEQTRRANPLAAVVSTKGCEKRGNRVFPHPFPARMPFEVAQAAVEAFSTRGQTVLDPMCGSGIVTRAAQLAGRKAIGRDIDPLAVHLSRAFCGVASSDTLLKTANKVLQQSKKLLLDPSYIPGRLKAMPKEDRRFIRYWFSRQAAAQLLALSDCVRKLLASPDRLFAIVMFSSCIISRSGGASYAMDLSRSRPHKVPTRKPKLPFELWSQRGVAFSKYLQALPKTDAGADIRLCDARKRSAPARAG